MNIYSPLHPAAQFLIQRRLRLVREVLVAAYPDGCRETRLLEVGCGPGQWLVDLQGLGLFAANLAGIELNTVRAAAAKERILGADIRQGDAAALPWPDGSFDIVFQSTMFTSVLDDALRRKIAAEMKRVCRPRGFILWYDFRMDSPSNAKVRGIPAREIRALFAPWACEIRSVSLAPPLARLVAPCCWSLAEDLETCLPFLRTHLLAKIAPP
jgi:ubiquinone/menaquinone biosynthesis C-methylase UbiE